MICLLVEFDRQHCQNILTLATEIFLQVLTLALKNKLYATRPTILLLPLHLLSSHMCSMVHSKRFVTYFEISLGS